MSPAEPRDFSALTTALEATSSEVERTLEGILPVPDGDEARVVAAMRYALFGGGKRLRPFLTVATADLFGTAREYSLRAGAAIECIHNYSLVHDDLPAMDDDDLRRGQPTVHKAYDEATAVLAGDALVTVAFEILAEEATHPDPGIRAALVASLARAAGYRGMVGGQMRDLAAEHRRLSEAEITGLQRMKTGALIVAAVEAGALLGGASAAEREALTAYSRALGLAFQIADDLLDHTASAAELGKAAQKDAEAGKATLVSLAGEERARAEAERLANQALAHLNGFSRGAELLRAVAMFAIHRRH